MRKITFLFLFIGQFSFGQSDQLQSILEDLDFKEDTVLTVFNWVTDNIAYDYSMVEDAKKSNTSRSKGKSKNKGKGQNQEDRNRVKLNHVLKKHKGVCEHYALLFDGLLQELGYATHIVTGYTKDSKGKINGSLGHAWNAVRVRGEWRLYDPTWAAGYIENKKFKKKYSKQWYNGDPDFMIKTHMPYDPIWQLKSDVYTYNDFKFPTEKIARNSAMDYDTVISLFLKQDDKQKLKAQLERSEELGEGNNLVRKWKAVLKKQLTFDEYSNDLDGLNKVAQLNQEASKKFSEYFKAKNKRFTGKKWTVDYSKGALTEIKDRLETSLEVYNNAELKDRKSKKTLSTAKRDCKKMLRQVKKELIFLEKAK